MPKPFHPDRDDVRVMVDAFARHEAALREAAEILEAQTNVDPVRDENLSRARKDAERAGRMKRAMEAWQDK
jgi:hypothetical protein